MSAENTKTAISGTDNFSSEDFISGGSETMERYLTFRTDNLIFGVSTNYIIEIITNHSITPVPMVPGYVKGIINLRGQIVPIPAPPVSLFLMWIPFLSELSSMP